MNRAMSFRDFEGALVAFDAFFDRTFSVPNIIKMQVDNFFNINIYCDNNKWYKFNVDTGEIKEHNINEWRQ